MHRIARNLIAGQIEHDAAVADALKHVDRCKDRWAEPEQAACEIQPFL